MEGEPGRPRGSGFAFILRVDRDGDGRISRDEATEPMRDRFSQLDRNGDGSITPEEFRDAIAREYDLDADRPE
jgi:Ca2+-binding EF-hand superfamily protein